MLRFWIVVSLVTTVVFTGIGLLVSRQWGWSEYASDKSYLVYTQVRNATNLYFVMNVNSGDAEKLLDDDKELNEVDCSPDGRIFAYLTNGISLHVLNENGVVYNQTLKDHWNITSVANSGAVSLTKYTGDNLIVTRDSIETPAYPRNFQSDSKASITSNGLILWENFAYSTSVLADSSGNIIESFPKAAQDRWLADEQSFVFLYPTYMDPYGMSGDLYIFDAKSQNAIPLQRWQDFMVLSPDRTKMADRQTIYKDDGSGQGQVFVSYTYTDLNPKQLTYDKATSASPMCFLTFRPQMLIADKP